MACTHDFRCPAMVEGGCKDTAINLCCRGRTRFPLSPQPKSEMTEALSKDELESRMTDLQARMVVALAPYEVESAACLWLDTLRASVSSLTFSRLAWAMSLSNVSLPRFRYSNSRRTLPNSKRSAKGLWGGSVSSSPTGFQIC